MKNLDVLTTGETQIENHVLCVNSTKKILVYHTTQITTNGILDPVNSTPPYFWRKNKDEDRALDNLDMPRNIHAGNN